MIKLAIIDVETTGLIPRKHPLELSDYPHVVTAAIACYDGRRMQSLTALMVKPDGWTVPKESQAIHGLPTELLEREGHQLNYVLDKIEEGVRWADIVAGYNVSFDLEILKAEFERCDRAWPEPNIEFCVMEEAKLLGFTKGDDRFLKLRELAARLFADTPYEAHTASSDAIMTAKAFFTLARMPNSRLYDLYSDIELEDSNPCFKAAV